MGGGWGVIVGTVMGCSGGDYTSSMVYMQYGLLVSLNKIFNKIIVVMKAIVYEMYIYKVQLI